MEIFSIIISICIFLFFLLILFAIIKIKFNFLLKGFLIGSLIGLFFSSSYLWLFYTSKNLFLYLSKFLIPYCGFFAKSTEALMICSFYFGHITNVILFGLIGLFISFIFKKILKN